MSKKSPLTRRNFLTGLAVAAAAVPMTKSYGGILSTILRRSYARPIMTVGRNNLRQYTKLDRVAANARLAALKSRRVLIPVNPFAAIY